MSSVFSIFCGTTFSSIFHFFKKQYQCLQELTKHYSSATVEEKFNGRTSADKLSRALKRNGYGWQQIKVFTSEGDLPATPAPPKYLKLWSGSISNYDAAREWAGNAWVHLHSLTITGHNGLRDSIKADGSEVPGDFEVNLGPYGSKIENTTVRELMLRDFRP